MCKQRKPNILYNAGIGKREPNNQYRANKRELFKGVENEHKESHITKTHTITNTYTKNTYITDLEKIEEVLESIRFLLELSQQEFEQLLLSKKIHTNKDKNNEEDGMLTLEKAKTLLTLFDNIAKASIAKDVSCIGAREARR